MTTQGIEFAHDARVHESTVQLVASEGVQLPRPAHARRKPRGSSRCVSVAVDQGVWKAARKLTTDPLCIQVVGPECVLVHNNRRWRNGR